MPQISPSIPILGQPSSSEDPKTQTALSQLVATVNALDSANIVDGTLTAADLQAALLDVLGVTGGGTTRRGYAQVQASETTTSTTLVDLATPGPSVTLTVPVNGLVIAGVQCDSIANSAGGGVSSQATLMVDGVPTIGPQSSSVSAVTASAATSGLFTTAGFVAAGTRTFKMQYKVSAASTGTFGGRQLWVVALKFP